MRMSWHIGWTLVDPLPESAMELWRELVAAATWWNVVPGDRLTTDTPHWKHRLIVLGNGQVTKQYHLAMETLKALPLPFRLE